MSRPHPQQILAPLKSFQRRTVEHAFHRLFTAQDSTQRFLVADEVGLGKTLVARGIIGRAVDYLWDTTERIDIVYICSNQSIAHSNLPKLQVSGESADTNTHATRLTMLATELASDGHGPGGGNHKINLISFTPGTSFNLGYSGGRSEERQVLFWLLQDMVSRPTGLMNLLQGRVGTNRWRRALEARRPLDPSIKEQFQRRVNKDGKLFSDLEKTIECWFRRVKEEYSDEARRVRNRLTGELRQLLALVCIDALEPDLVLLDEFQRFKALVNQDEAYPDHSAQLAQRLLKRRNARGQPVRTLLLSATPYKLYTSDVEVEEDNHYTDFLATTRFLLDYDPSRVKELQDRLVRFGKELKRAASGQEHDVEDAKEDAETSLRAVMARTERVTASADGDAMVEEPRVPLQIQSGDVLQYLAGDAWFRAVGARDPMAFWKAGPYLPHFMQGYKVNDRVAQARSQHPERLLEVLEKYPEAFLDHRVLSSWGKLDPNHTKLRRMVVELLDTGLWQLLWMPPSLPYWALGGPFKDQQNQTKTLLFSAWNFVPDVVSAVLSYEAERRMMGGGLAQYQAPDRQRPPLLRLTDQQGTRSRHRLLLLLMPCLPLADYAHPLLAPEGFETRSWVRSRVAELLEQVENHGDSTAPSDPRWEYLAPILIDPGLREFLTYWSRAPAKEVGNPNPESLPAYLADLLSADLSTLGRQPDGLADLLTNVALGSPGVVAARTLAVTGASELCRRAEATRVAQAFWNLFNRPAVISLLEQLYGGSRYGGQRTYWRSVLSYCVDGNLQAVLDETWHLSWEQRSWSQEISPGAVTRICVDELVGNIEPRASRVHAKFWRANGRSLESDELRIRTTFAQRFGDIQTDQGVISQDTVRSAFNSPFRPFVLTSTSVGQEGLDFHPWCHRLVHWNLPSNPVDLEQREGRIHRFKGHAVRRNVANQRGPEGIREWVFGFDIWDQLFELADRAARADGVDDLVPHWIMPGPYKVQRYVPALPYTREVETFRRLRYQLATYRVAFGQPRQEELLSMLEVANVPIDRVKEWTIRLNP